jgi:hypothetical protein
MSMGPTRMTLGTRSMARGHCGVLPIRDSGGGRPDASLPSPGVAPGLPAVLQNGAGRSIAASQIALIDDM